MLSLKSDDIQPLANLARFLVAPLKKQLNPDFKTKSGFFVFQWNAKNGRILPFPVFQSVEQERWSGKLLRMSFLLIDSQYFACQESVYGFLLLSNEKKLLEHEKRLIQCAFLHQESQTAEKRGSLRMYAHHGERCASGKQHPHEH